MNMTVYSLLSTHANDTFNVLQSNRQISLGWFAYHSWRMSFQSAATADRMTLKARVDLAEKDLKKLADGGLKSANARMALIRTLERRLNELGSAPIVSQEDREQERRIRDLCEAFNKKKPELIEEINQQQESDRQTQNNQDAGKQEQTQQALTEEDLLREQLEFMYNQTQDITHQMREINEVQSQLYAKVKSDSGLIVKVDQTIESAKDDMIAGNVQLDEAEKHLKKTCNVQ